MRIGGRRRSYQEAIEDYVREENRVRVIDAFVGMLDFAALGFERVVPEGTGRPSYHPATMLRTYVYSLSQPGTVVAWPRAGVPPEPGADLAHRLPSAGPTVLAPASKGSSPTQLCSGTRQCANGRRRHERRRS